MADKEKTWDTFWRETMSFRWVTRENKTGEQFFNSLRGNVLQQKWMVNGTEKFEWRDVPVEKEN